MKARSHLLVVVTAATVILEVASPCAPALAAKPDPCLDAPVEGQKLQRAGKLLDARERFAVCADRACPAVVVDRCVQWMQQVDAALPSVVAAARDVQGRDLTDARVSVDGGPLSEPRARATPLDPGPHMLVFSRSGSADVRREVVLREGEKNREVVATFGGPADPREATSPAGEASGVRPVPLAVWVTGGVGVAALGVFTTFGALGVAQRGADHCDTGCAQADKSAVDSKYLVANVSLGVGVIAATVAIWLYLARPTVAAAGPVSPLVSSPGSVGLRF